MTAIFRVRSRMQQIALAAAVGATVCVAGDGQAQAQGPWGGAGGRKAAGRYAEVNGIKLYYEIHGAGQPIILLHGGLGAIDMFGPTLPELARHRRVIAVDLQGHGRTEDIDRPLSVEFMGDDIAALIKHLGLPRADIMGYSLGAGVALQTAIRHPELVGKLVVVSAIIRRNAFYPDILKQQEQVNAQAAEFMKQTPMYQLYSAIAPKPENFPKLLDKIGAFMKQDFDYTREIAKVKATTLVVAADADIFPPSHAVELFGLLGGGQRDGGWDGAGQPKSKLAILPGLTHYNIFSDTAVLGVALPFLNAPIR